MKRLFFFLSLFSLIGFSFAISNITDDDLEGILAEVNAEIEKEIMIIAPIEVSTPSGSCEVDVKEECEDEIDLAVKKLNEMGATKFSNSKDFMTDKNVRRDEAAKMFLKFSEGAKILPTKKTDLSCSFSDLDMAWSDIVPMIGQVCQYGLFKGSKGKFMPLDNITNGQAVIVLIRLVDGKKEEIDGVGHYAENYMKKADELGLLKDLGIKDVSTWDKPATRGLVAKILYRSSDLK